jgi:hypothetical protein
MWTLPWVCRVCGRKQNYPELNDSGSSRGSSSCEPIQQTGYKPVERIDFVGKNATTVACDHPRSRRKSIHRRFERNRGVRRNTKSIRYKHGRSLRIIHDKESIYVNTARGCSLRMLIGNYNPNLMAHSLQIDSRKGDRLGARRFSYPRTSSHG